MATGSSSGTMPEGRSYYGEEKENGCYHLSRFHSISQ